MKKNKYRGKREDNDEWVYGCFVKYKKGCQLICAIVDEEGTIYQVERETVGQYIGKTTMRGLGIYEGDILVNLYGELGLVVFDPPAFVLDRRIGNQINQQLSHVMWVDEYFEDVKEKGNKWDNPELLEEGY